MMGSKPDLSALKDIPGYKAILKTVLKSQIQLLLEQLAENTGEESIILTACINDGSLSHLGSSMGKNFLDGREEIKSQFLGFCLKGHHQMRQDEDRNQMFGRSNIMNMPQHGSSRRPRIRPHPYSMSPPHSQSSSNNRSNLQDLPNTTPPFLKTEDGSVNSVDNFLDSVSSDVQDSQMGMQASVNMNHTQASSQDRKNGLNQPGLSAEKEYQSTSSDVPIKIEPGSDDLDDEVRIIESEENSASSETWGQGDPNETDQSRFNSVNNSSNHYSCHFIERENSTHKIFKCNYCGKQSFRKGDIDRHIVQHTNQKRFTCNECQKGFTRKRGLMLHLENMHPSSKQRLSLSQHSTRSPSNYLPRAPLI